MKFTQVFAGALLGSLISLGAWAQTPPAGSTGLCKDGSYTDHESKKGACAGHKGVKEWFAAAATAPAAAAAPAASSVAAPAPAPAPAASKAAAKPAAPAAVAAAGGGDGKVWVNSASKVYHCAGSKYYGKTKAGAYMTEAEAKAAGNHPNHGKACG